MRRFCAIAVVFVFTGCAGPGPGDARPRIDVHQRRPSVTCGRWIPAEHRVGLPADSSIRTLWTWRLRDDDVYTTSGLAGALVGPFAVSPDERLWVIGPEPNRVMTVVAGRLEWISEPFSGEIRKVAALPDGSVLTVSDDLDGFTKLGRLRTAERTPVNACDIVLEAPGDVSVAVGSGGMVAFGAGHDIEMCCVGVGSLRRVQLVELGAIHRLVGTREGELWLMDSSRDAITSLRWDGALAAHLPGGDDAPSYALTAMHDDALLVLAQAGSRLDAEVWSRSGGFQWSAREPSPTTDYVLDPTANVWFSSLPVRIGRFTSGTLAWSSSDVGFAAHRVVFDDGSLLSANPASGELIRIGTDGVPMWSHPLQNAEGVRLAAIADPGALLVSDTGVAYVRASDGDHTYIVAIQTDALPSGGCPIVGCNARQDGSTFFPE